MDPRACPPYGGWRMLARQGNVCLHDRIMCKRRARTTKKLARKSRVPCDDRENVPFLSDYGTLARAHVPPTTSSWSRTGVLGDKGGRQLSSIPGTVLRHGKRMEYLTLQDRRLLACCMKSHRETGFLSIFEHCGAGCLLREMRMLFIYICHFVLQPHFREHTPFVRLASTLSLSDNQGISYPC